MARSKKLPESDDKTKSPTSSAEVTEQKPCCVEGGKGVDTGAIVWAFILIFVGVVLLLNTLGVVSWSIWNYLWRFWPIFLVMAGVGIILGKSRIAGVAIAIVTLVVFVGVFIFSISAVSSNLPTWLSSIGESLSGDVGDEVTEELVVSSAEYPDVENLDIELNIGAAEFTLDSDGSRDLFVMNAEYFENFGRPVVEVEETWDSDDTLNINFDTETDMNLFTFPTSSPVYGFTLGASDVDADVAIDLGAGKGTVNLSRNNVSGFSAIVGAGELDAMFESVSLGEFYGKVGAGQMTVSFLDGSLPVDGASFEVGAGQITLILPEDVGYRLSYSVGVGSVRITGRDFSGLGRNDDSYESDNYDTAGEKIDIAVNVGVGSFVLELD